MYRTLNILLNAFMYIALSHSFLSEYVKVVWSTVWLCSCLTMFIQRISFFMPLQSGRLKDTLVHPDKTFPPTPPGFTPVTCMCVFAQLLLHPSVDFVPILQNNKHYMQMIVKAVISIAVSFARFMGLFTLPVWKLSSYKQVH